MSDISQTSQVTVNIYVQVRAAEQLSEFRPRELVNFRVKEPLDITPRPLVDFRVVEPQGFRVQEPIDIQVPPRPSMEGLGRAQPPADVSPRPMPDLSARMLPEAPAPREISPSSGRNAIPPPQVGAGPPRPEGIPPKPVRELAPPTVGAFSPPKPDLVGGAGLLGVLMPRIGPVEVRPVADIPAKPMGEFPARQPIYFEAWNLAPPPGPPSTTIKPHDIKPEKPFLPEPRRTIEPSGAEFVDARPMRPLDISVKAIDFQPGEFRAKEPITPGKVQMVDNQPVRVTPFRVFNTDMPNLPSPEMAKPGELAADMEFLAPQERLVIKGPGDVPGQRILQQIISTYEHQPMSHFHYHYQAVPVEHVPPPPRRGVTLPQRVTAGAVVNRQS